MADTSRLDRLTEMVERAGAKLVAIGDGAQLPSIGAGGMFDRLTEIAPSAELSDVRRTLDPAEQRAWADLRAGRSDRAMAHYHRRGRLHMTDTRDQAVEHAVQAGRSSPRPPDQRGRVDLRRLQPGDPPSQRPRAALPRTTRRTRRARGRDARRSLRHSPRRPGSDDRAAPRAGRRAHRERSQGEVLDITPAGEALIEFNVTGRQRTLAGDDLGASLGYAHPHPPRPGATVTRTLVVTGGWQTSKEPAYVEASRARQGTDWYVNREDLGTEGHDTDRIQRLATNMRRSHAQTPSLAHPERAYLRLDAKPQSLTASLHPLANTLAHPHIQPRYAQPRPRSRT